ncbi:hypothetical protein Y032_1107g3615 [Ancylostoma ceylanicum]|uniref:Uncharacterized protein n=1 Tax=Ancylostoma ceylanicum TaxID=53326 RepID=A0A016W5W5_9BILA|nr:hypothetical protein Y032_1107g3615 [Ancylostoma ceylanicum]
MAEATSSCSKISQTYFHVIPLPIAPAGAKCIGSKQAGANREGLNLNPNRRRSRCIASEGTHTRPVDNGHSSAVYYALSTSQH